MSEEDPANKAPKSRRQRTKSKKKPPHKENPDQKRGQTDTKVVLIKEDLMCKWRKQDLLETSIPHNSSWQLADYLQEFPSLGSYVKTPITATTCCSDENETLAETKFGTTHQAHSNPVNHCSKITKREALPSERDTPPAENSTKIKKSKALIILDFSSTIKSKKDVSLRKPTFADKRQKSSQLGLKLTGNTLDSSTPIRHKGKFRENKKIKLSPLKANIIKDRIMKSLSQIRSSEPTVSDAIDFKKEIKIYLDHLKAEREAVARQHSSSVKLQNVKPLSSPTKFTSKFRDYCENILTDELNAAVKQLVQSLVQLQDRAFIRDPVRARARKRYVTGLREATKYLKLKRVQLLILAPDLESSASDGAITKVILELKNLSQSANCLCVFALDRRKLGYCSLRKTPVSAFAVLRVEGLETAYEEVVRAHAVARQLFLQNFVQKFHQDSETDQITCQLQQLNMKSIDTDHSQSECETSDKLNPFIKAIQAI